MPARSQVAPATESSFCISDEQFDSILRNARATHNADLPNGVTDLGTYELVEGDLARGYAHLFFTARHLNGDLFLVRSSFETGVWSASRKPQPFPQAETAPARRHSGR